MRSKYHFRTASRALLFAVVLCLSAGAGADCRYALPLPVQSLARTATGLRLERLGGLREGDEIGLKFSIKCGGSGTINVRHRTGIGSLKIISSGKHWPKKLKLQFQNFNSLENVTISGAGQKFEFAQKYEYGKIPSRTIEVPQALLRDGHREITVSWVDAYR